MWRWLLLALSVVVFPKEKNKVVSTAPPQFQLTVNERLNLSVKSPTVKYYYRLNKSGIEIYANPTDWKYNKRESMIYFDESDLYNKIYYSLDINKVIDLYTKKGVRKFNPEKFNPLIISPKPFVLKKTNKPLEGLRIALDPGHFAGNPEEAIWEMRLARIKTPKGDVLQVFESELTYATALFLRDTLESLGATVLLSRDAMGHTAFNKSFSKWIDEDLTDAVIDQLRKGYISKPKANKLLISSDKRYIFRAFFQKYELHQRAKKINAFRPHFTLIIHYNADSQNRRYDGRGNQLTTKYDYNMTFVPGAYIAGEMRYKEQRLNFARIVLSNQIERSMELAYFVSTRLNEELGLHSYPLNGNQLYMKKVANYTGYEGVYARNLALTRLINGPLCYGETLYQDNASEIERLSKKDLTIHGIKTSERVKQVAIGYFNGIMDYLNYKQQLP